MKIKLKDIVYTLLCLIILCLFISWQYNREYLIFGIHNPRFSYTKQVKDNEKKAEWENLMKRIEKWKKKEIELKEQGVPEDSLMHYQICYMLVWGYEDDKKEGETLEEYCARANNNLKEVLDELNKNK